MQNERCQIQKAELHNDSIYMTFWRRQNPGDRTKISGCLGLVGGIVCKGTLENFWVMELFYIFIMVVVHDCMHQSKLVELTTPKSNFFAICKLYRS